MKKTEKLLLAALALTLGMSVQACVSGKRLSTASAEPGDLQGTYTLLLYGCHYPREVKNLVILVSENSKYPVDIYDIPSSYTVKKGVQAGQALNEANSFLTCTSYKMWRTQLRKITDDTGGTVGFELRPLYFPLEFGYPDVLLVNYVLKDGAVTAYIKLDPDVEKAQEASGSDKGDFSGGSR